MHDGGQFGQEADDEGRSNCADVCASRLDVESLEEEVHLGALVEVHSHDIHAHATAAAHIVVHATHVVVHHVVRVGSHLP